MSKLSLITFRSQCFSYLIYDRFVIVFVAHQPKIIFACSIRQLKFSLVKILQYTVLACSSLQLYSYPAITIWKASSKLKKLDRDHACLCTSGFGTIFWGPFSCVVINHPGGPFMLVIIGSHAWVGLGPFMFYPDHLCLCISGPAGPSMTT